MLRHMAYHYMARNKSYKARIRSLKAKLKRASRRKKEKDRLQILAKAFLVQHNNLWRTISPNLKKFGTPFSFLKILGQNTGFFWPMCCATWCSILMEASKWGKINIFGLFMKKYACLLVAKKFWQVLNPQKGRKHPKNDLSAPIWTHRKQCWENSVLERKMKAKFKNSTCSGK